MIHSGIYRSILLFIFCVSLVLCHGDLEFTCGGTRIPLSQVNDDFCDCPDGSDEPSTSACSGKIKFYCANHGYKEEWISTSRVQDGICDCCDGSDEPPGTCENDCDVVGREYRELKAKEEEIRKLGLQKKQEYLVLGEEFEKSKASFDEQIKSLEASLGATDEILEKVRSEKAAIEEAEEEKKKEREKLIREKRIESLKLEKLTRQQLEILLVDFAVESNHNTLMNLIRNVLPDEQIDWSELPPEENKEVEEECPVEEPEEEDHEDDPYAEEQVDDDEDEPHDEAENDSNKKERKCTVDTPLKLIKRKESQLNSEKNKVQKELDKLKQDIDRDYGPGNIFYPLQGQCYSATIEKYEYKMCPFDSAKQDHTSLGKWSGISDDFASFKFENGAKCWNGPSRSLTVKLKCGKEEKILEVSEPEMCTYMMEFETPAAC